jgi:hypothetical protein
MQRFWKGFLLLSASYCAIGAGETIPLRSIDQLETDIACLTHLVDNSGLWAVSRMLVERIKSPLMPLTRQAENISLLMQVQFLGTKNLFHHYGKCSEGDYVFRRCVEATGARQTLSKVFRADRELAEKLFSPGGLLFTMRFFPEGLTESYVTRFGEPSFIDRDALELFDDVLASEALKGSPTLAAYFIRAFAEIGDLYDARRSQGYFGDYHRRTVLPPGFVDALPNLRNDNLTLEQRHMILDALHDALVFKLRANGSRPRIWDLPDPYPLSFPRAHPLARVFMIRKSALTDSPDFLRWADQFASRQSDWANYALAENPSLRKEWLKITLNIREAAIHALASDSSPYAE